MIFGFMGALMVAVILWDAFETVLVPRRIGRRVRLTRYFYLIGWALWRALASRVRRTSPRESLLGFFGPLSLIVLLTCWAAGLIAAFAMLQYAVASAAERAQASVFHLLYMSGQTFFTLGYGDATPLSHMGRLFAVLEAGMGFGFLGTVIGYLPTQYAGFAQRELEISLMDSRAGSPPTAAEFARRVPRELDRSHRDEIFRDWERWSAQLLETHISYPQLAYYRSQHTNQSWLSMLTVILDSSALILASPEGKQDVRARRSFAMARHALVDISQIFVTSYTPVAHDRLPPESFAVLRDVLAASGRIGPEDAEFGARLARYRLLYEPYAQALAARLLYTLPDWVPAKGARDNWMGGAWDRILGSKCAALGSDIEHF